MKKYIVTLLLLGSIKVYAQTNHTTTFTSPLDIPLTLSGNFGELRPNHFHGGLDFKTQNTIGKRVLAIADGYISRIMVTHGSGYMLHVRYSNGYTAIYRHLSGFVKPMADAIEAYQYEKESWEVDLIPSATQYPVHAGQQIAWSGNTGYSMGPHLHLDLIEDATGDRLDPLPFFSKYIKDNRAPRAEAIMIFPQPGKGVVQGRLQNKIIALNTVGPTEAWGVIGAGIKAYDYMTGTSNRYGVYSVTLYVDGAEVYNSVVDRYSPDENRMINSWTHGHFMKSFIDPGNTLRMLSAHNAERGLVTINEERDYHFLYELKDYYGNTARYRFVISGKKQPVPPLEHKEKYLFKWDQVNYLQEPGMTLIVPKGVLYTDLPVQFKVYPDSNAVSYIYQLNDEGVPLHASCELSIGVRRRVVQDTTKYYIARKTGSRLSSVGGRYENGFVKAKILSLGTYVVAVDTVPPVVTPLSKNTWARAGKILYRVKDGQTGIRSYRGTIDGKYALFQWEMMTNRLICKIDPTRVSKTGKHIVELTVTDHCGNVTVLKDIY